MENEEKKEGWHPVGDDYVVRFGKYKDNPKMIKDIPAQYFLYLYRQDILFGELKDYVKYNMDALKKRDKEERGK